jgi:hypothetical protein
MRVKTEGNRLILEMSDEEAVEVLWKLTAAHMPDEIDPMFSLEEWTAITIGLNAIEERIDKKTTEDDGK